MSFNEIPSDEIIQRTMAALEANGIKVILVENGEEAKKKFLELVPEGAEIMNNTSTTLNQIGLTDIILTSGKYKAVREKFKLPDVTEQQKLAWGAAPEYSTGSVHAITQDGHVMIASQGGSQLSSYANAAQNILWIAGAHKIVTDLNEGFRRIYEHSLPLENERAMQAYGKGSAVNKVLIINKEVKASRITLILVKEVLGF